VIADPAWAVAFSPNGSVIAVGSRGAIALVDVNTYAVSYAQINNEVVPPIADIRTLCFSPDGKWIACGGSNGVLIGVETATSRLRWVKRSRFDEIKSIGIDRAMQLMTVVGNADYLEIYETNRSMDKSIVSPFQWGARTMCSVDGGMILIGCNDTTIIEQHLGNLARQP
jgi:WD40 repeat protein